MGTVDRPLTPRKHSGDLIDRVIQLRRVLSGVATEHPHLRRELARLRQANRVLERELGGGLRPGAARKKDR